MAVVTGDTGGSSSSSKSKSYVFPYKYKMGIKVGDVAIPDPSSWNYQVGDLDTSGRRDAKGLLHRAYVATKINYEFEWKALEWEMLDTMLAAVQKPKFTLTAPDPREFKKKYKGSYYVGDRTGSCHYYVTDKIGKYDPKTETAWTDPVKPEIAVYSLKLKFIEY